MLAVIFTTAVFSCILTAQICYTGVTAWTLATLVYLAAGSWSSQPAQPLLALFSATDVIRLSWSLAGTHSPTGSTLTPGRLDARLE